MNIGNVVFYNAFFSLHNEINTDRHQKESFYNKTTYYGCMQISHEYEIIGNIHQNPELL